MAVLTVCLLIWGWMLSMMAGVNLERIGAGKARRGSGAGYGFLGLAVLLVALICAARAGA